MVWTAPELPVPRQNPGSHCFEVPTTVAFSGRNCLDAEIQPHQSGVGRSRDVCLRRSWGMAGTAPSEQRRCRTRIARSQHRTPGPKPRDARTGGEDRRLPGSRSRCPSPAVGRSETGLRPYPTPSEFWLYGSSSHSGARFASGGLLRVRGRDPGTRGAGFQLVSPHTDSARHFGAQ